MYRLSPKRLCLVGILLLFALFSTHIGAQSSVCNWMCQLGVNQTESITVQEFINVLLEHGWLENDPTDTLYASYYQDTYSQVLETTTIIPLDGVYPPIFQPDVKLYIGSVDGIQPDHTQIPFEEIEKIQFTTTIPIWMSWLVYGLPEGGNVLPFYSFTDADLACMKTYNSIPYYHYLAYYDNGKMIIRADFTDSISFGFLLTPVEVVYVFDYLEYYASLIGHFEQIKLKSCPFT